MTEEDKKLLLFDLCARLPYGVKCTDNKHGDSRVTQVDINPTNNEVLVYYFDFDECGKIESCVPYLRLMSSITEEEKREYDKLFTIHSQGETYCENWEWLDFMNSHHFDYRGLIRKGLALEAPEGTYESYERKNITV